jgi:hypothetical protein
MALVVADLLAPDGMLELDLFDATEPGGGTEERAAVWLAQGEEAATLVATTAARDKAARWYAYHRAWAAKADRLAAQLSNADLTGLSYTIAASQYKHFEQRAKEALAEYENIIESGGGTTISAVGERVTASIQHKIRW